MTLQEAREALSRAAVEAVEKPSFITRAALCSAAEEYARARLAAASGGAAAQKAAPAKPKTAPKVKQCSRCGGDLVWGVFGNGFGAAIEPQSLECGFDVRANRFGSLVPHFEKTKGHRLHVCRVAP